MGRKKLGALRNQAAQHGWLDPQQPLPDDCALAILQQRRQQAMPTQCVSTLKDHEEQIAKWAAEGIQGTTIHAALVRNHGSLNSAGSHAGSAGAVMARPAGDETKTR